MRIARLCCDHQRVGFLDGAAMTSQPSEQIVYQRLRHSLTSLLCGLDAFLAQVANNERNASKHWLRVSKDEVLRTAAYLSQVGLNADAQQLADSAGTLHGWQFYSVLPEAFADCAAKRPENDHMMRQLFGNFPSQSELAQSEERRICNHQMVSIARNLAGQLRQISSLLPAPTVGSPPVSEPLTDNSAYRPASEFINPASFPENYKELHQALEANAWIRQSRPISKRTGAPVSNRLLVHAGDWHEFLRRRNQTTTDPLDLPAAFVDAAVQEIAQRKADERQKKETR
jgi:hypothetical protein